MRAVETTTASILPSVTDRNLLQDGTTEIEVTGLALRQVLEFTGFTARDAALETGTLSIEFGQWAADSSNFTPQTFWNAGCQLVALNFQSLGN